MSAAAGSTSTPRQNGSGSRTPRVASAQTEEEEIVREICSNNGINYARLEQEGPTCKCVEMFFSGFPRIVGLENFPNITTLTIMGQMVEKIEGIESLNKLKELWIAECDLKKIEGLNKNTALRRLYLYNNEIEKIEGLDKLKDLEVLWLNDNEITVIEGIAHMKYLRELNLAANLIDHIGNSLNTHLYLENLDLSGNSISSFKDLTNLGKLPRLKILGLKNPAYAPNPACLLCNYSTHILYHLPTVQMLDGHDVSNKALRELAETTVIKKKMYYNMKAKTLRRNLTEVTSRLAKVKEALETPPHQTIRDLFFMHKEIEREVRELSTYDGDSDAHESGTESDKDTREAKAAEDLKVIENLKNKQTVLKDRIAKWEQKCEEYEAYYQQAVSLLRERTDTTLKRLIVELETGGNVRFEDGTSSDPWFQSCHDLILSRFCAADYKEQGILGIKIHRITRVHNRILRARFEDALSALVDDEDAYLPGSRPVGYKKLLEYLFWVWDPDLPGGQHEVNRVVEEGFMDAATYRKMGKDGAVPLTNSLNLADRFRMKSCSKNRDHKQMYADRCPYRHGQLVIAKVYLGKNQTCHDNKVIDRARFPRVDSVYRPRKHADVEVKPTVTSSITNHSNSPRCECTNRQCDWFIFNHHLVIPEYVVDFEYVTRVKPMSPFASQNEGLLENKQTAPVGQQDELSGDEEILNMEPAVRPRPRLITLTEDLLLSTAKASSLSNIRILNLHGNGLTKIKQVHLLPNLKKLVVSFNELTKLEDVSQLNLEYLDASFNKISTLDGMKNLNRLKYLDVSWNQLCNTREEISMLRKHVPVLLTLDLRHNHWQKPEGLRLRAIGRIKSLTQLNGETVTENEAAAALRMAAGSRVSQVSLLAHSRTDSSRPRTLSLASYAHVLSQISRNKPDRTSEQDCQWYAKVTTLNLDSQHISKLSNLERLENLRWASFCDNDITKIEGLESCINLEELSLENNCISKIEGLSKLTKLRRLNVDHNYITTLDGAGLERLPQLHHLSMESNKIKSLFGIQRLTALIELYAGNNLIENVREVFYLKSLPSLLILDLYGNPAVASANKYRLFVIFHLKPLKALDGQSIEPNESNMAKDTFGGRLTQDFIAERLGLSSFNELRELDFPNCSIRTVDLGNGQAFLNLRSVNLEHNNLTSFSGLVQLVNLRVLCLNHNHIECIVPRPKQPPPVIKSKVGSLPSSQSSSNNLMNPENYTPVLENLEVLHLGYNGIKEMGVLQLSRLTSLKALFLQGNEIAKIEGLEGVQDLRELVLDRNKIKSIGEYSFVNQWNLQELHLEENRIRELSNLCHLESLQRLFLGMNRLQDIGELEKLEGLNNLLEISTVSNSVSRRLVHRPMLVYKIPSLMMIDGIPVSDEERAKAELYFMEQQPPQITTTVETTLPGIGQYKASIPVKVTNMQLVSPHLYENTWGGTIHYADHVLQQELQRASRQPKKNNNRDNSMGNLNMNNAQRISKGKF